MTHLLSKHRIEALADGIFAVTMTLLVIELKVPEHIGAGNDAQLKAALFGLIPTVISWLISFMVLAIFWIANHRLFHYVRHVDMPLLWLTMVLLAGASLMPFATTLNNQHASVVSQWVYGCTMIAMGLSTVGTAAYLYRHPELCGTSFARPLYLAALARSAIVVVVACASIALSYVVVPGTANLAFLLMFLARRVGDRLAKRHAASEPAPAPLQ